MDVYWVNCFLASGLAFILGKMYAERQFKRMLSEMLHSGRLMQVQSANKTNNDSK